MTMKLFTKLSKCHNQYSIRILTRIQVALSPALGNTGTNSSTHTIILGDNNNTNIRLLYSDMSGRTDNETTYLPNILSALEYRTFWLNWSETTLTLGRGPYVNFDVLFTHDMEVDSTAGITLKSPNSAGNWEIVSQFGKNFV